MSRRLTQEEREEFPQSDFQSYPVSPYAELQIGPDENLEEAARLGSELGTAKNSHNIIRHVAAMYPAALRTAASLPPDHFRTATIDDDELRRAAKGVLKKGQSVVEGSGRVRGRHGGERVVSFLIETETGRSARAILPYDDFPRSARAFEEAPGFNMLPGGQRAVVEGSAGEGRVRTEVVSGKDAEALQSALEENEALRDQLNELRARLEGSEDDDSRGLPIDNYDELRADDVVEELRNDGLGRFGAEGLDAIERYESENKNRQGVLKAVEKAREPRSEE